MVGTGRVLVTGATGFIGRVLCHRLKIHGAYVSGLAREYADGPWNSMLVADICLDQLREDAFQGIDTIFHLAGKTPLFSDVNQKKSEYLRLNVCGTREVLEAASKAKIRRFIFISSVKAGGEGSDVCLDETMEDNPETPYGRTKLQAERLVFKYAREHEMDAVVLRLPLVYGPGHKGNLNRMLQAVASRRFPPLPEFNNQRSMVHVEDVARAAILAAECPQANVQTYIVTDGRPYSTREIYSLMSVALGRGQPRLSVPKEALHVLARISDVIGRWRGHGFLFDSEALKKLSSSAWYSSKKIENELGFRPEYDLEKALPEMIESLRGEHQSNVDPAPTS